MATESELLAALQELVSLPDTDESALTTGELADRLHVSQRVVRQILKAAIAEGRVEAIRVRRKTISGSAADVPAYRVVKGEGDDEESDG